jgi:hypothetical protein
MRAFQLSSTIEAMPEAAKEESALSLAALLYAETRIRLIGFLLLFCIRASALLSR